MTNKVVRPAAGSSPNAWPIAQEIRPHRFVSTVSCFRAAIFSPFFCVFSFAVLATTARSAFASIFVISGGGG